MPDTIYALSTPPGEGGVAVIRVSGPGVPGILRGCFPHVRKIEPRKVRVDLVRDENGEAIDECLWFYMAAPRSYTREDVAELQCHGGAVCARRVMERVAGLGARSAEPGEFTRRAFENGRISLSQAEMVMELISARSRAAARAALRQMETDGGLKALRAGLIEMLSHISAADDFPEEVDEPVVRAELEEGLEKALSALNAAADPKKARLIREGAAVALSGSPNVGKSSLMNALLGFERAIVDPEAGTTRDVLSERVQAGGRLFTLMDTAGQRQDAGRVEMAGIARAVETEKTADVVVAVLDLSRPLYDSDRELLSRRDERFIVAENKCDLPAARERVEGSLPVSARTGEGMDALMEEILRRTDVSGQENLLIAPRQIEIARQAAGELEEALAALCREDPVDLAAIPLWEAARRLGEITGEEASETVIDAVFSRFCVGK